MLETVSVPRATRESEIPKIVSWTEYTTLLKILNADLQLRGFDKIVGIGRGGSIIAAFLASKLGIPTFTPLFVRHVGRGEEMKIVVDGSPQFSILRGRLLVVDDWLCDGRAMTYVLSSLPKDAHATTAVMFCRTGSSFRPDLVGAYVDADQRGIVFPYDSMG